MELPVLICTSTGCFTDQTAAFELLSSSATRIFVRAGSDRDAAILLQV